MPVVMSIRLEKGVENCLSWVRRTAIVQLQGRVVEQAVTIEHSLAALVLIAKALVPMWMDTVGS